MNGGGGTPEGVVPGTIRVESGELSKYSVGGGPYGLCDVPLPHLFAQCAFADGLSKLPCAMMLSRLGAC